MGMFSLPLDQLMEVPPEMASTNCRFRTKVKTGSGLKRKAAVTRCISFVLCYEKADWNEMTWHAKLLQIPDGHHYTHLF